MAINVGISDNTKSNPAANEQIPTIEAVGFISLPRPKVFLTLRAPLANPTPNFTRAPTPVDKNAIADVTLPAIFPIIEGICLVIFFIIVVTALLPVTLANLGFLNIKSKNFLSKLINFPIKVLCFTEFFATFLVKLFPIPLLIARLVWVANPFTPPYFNALNEPLNIPLADVPIPAVIAPILELTTFCPNFEPLTLPNIPFPLVIVSWVFVRTSFTALPALVLPKPELSIRLLTFPNNPLVALDDFDATLSNPSLSSSLFSSNSFIVDLSSLNPFLNKPVNVAAIVAKDFVWLSFCSDSFSSFLSSFWSCKVPSFLFSGLLNTLSLDSFAKLSLDKIVFSSSFLGLRILLITLLMILGFLSLIELI